MRPVERIDRILGLIRELWMESPDLRLFQLLGNATTNTTTIRSDPYYYEDADLEMALHEYRVWLHGKEG